MSPRPRIGWICNSAIVKSETFLSDNLELLQSFAEVKAFSGNKVDGKGHPDVEALNFDNVPQRIHHVIWGKLTGRDLRTLSKRKRCLNQLKRKLEDFKPDLLWIEFGTTAHIASDLIAHLGKPYIIAVHGFDVSSEFRDAWYQAELMRLIRCSSKVVCASQFIRNKLIAIGAPSDQCSIVRLSVNAPEKIEGFKTPNPSFIYVGRLVEVKGPTILIRAFKLVTEQNPDATLSIIGSGPLLNDAKMLTEELGISENVQFLGALHHQQTLAAMDEHWAICQPGITSQSGQQEAFGLSLAEAAARGLPVIATNFGGIPEHVQHGKTGFLINEWDIEGFSNAMLHIARNQEQARTMGQAGRQNILSLCSPSKRSDALQALIQSAL